MDEKEQKDDCQTTKKRQTVPDGFWCMASTYWYIQSLGVQLVPWADVESVKRKV